MLLAGIQKLAISDYPGKTGCIVFVKGCNYRCPWCNATEYLLQEEQADSLNTKEVLDFLRLKKGILQACTLSGGEPTIYQDLPEFCRQIKKLGYSIKLDTNGSFPSMISRLVKKKLVDYVAMDVKAPKEKYASVIGYPDHTINYLFDKLEQSMKILKNSEVDYEFKTTVVPFLYKEDILKIAHWLRPAKRYVLQVFKPENTLDPTFAKLGAYSAKYINQLQQTLSPFFDSCEVR